MNEGTDGWEEEEGEEARQRGKERRAERNLN